MFLKILCVPIQTICSNSVAQRICDSHLRSFQCNVSAELCWEQMPAGQTIKAIHCLRIKQKKLPHEECITRHGRVLLFCKYVPVVKMARNLKEIGWYLREKKTHFKEYELAKIEEAWLADPVMTQWSYRPEGWGVETLCYLPWLQVQYICIFLFTTELCLQCIL